MEEKDYQRILDCIDPSLTNNQQWVTVGMALKYEGMPFEMFDNWSANDRRPGQYQGTDYTFKRWESFRSSGVTGATLTQMARDQGNEPFAGSNGPRKGGSLHWGQLLYGSPEQPFKTENCRPRYNGRDYEQLIDFLEALFEPEEHVNILTNTAKNKKGKYYPVGTGITILTRDAIIDSIRKYSNRKDWFDCALGSYTEECGAWFRPNPITDQMPEDAHGVSDKEITSFRFVLVECDTLTIDEQMDKIEELNLPYTTLVHSGGKSVHALIRVDARNRGDYQAKADFIFDYCKRHGFPVDEQNKNPSRLSRFPGIMRNGKRQCLLDLNKNPISFDEWKTDAEAREKADILDVYSFADVCEEPPELSPVTVEGVLREGHKMMISGPSKSGKSFSLINHAVARAEGTDWMGCKCRQGKVLYINCEIDNASFIKRVIDVYAAKGLQMKHPENIEILSLRGRTVPLDELAPILKYKVDRGQYSAVILDPIYKVITGDENSARDMAVFCNLMDYITKVGHCDFIFAHHHSKGFQFGKNAMDRASGSGVFARDPDALIDLTPLQVSDYNRQEIRESYAHLVDVEWLKSTGEWESLNEIDQKDRIKCQDWLLQYFDNGHLEDRPKWEQERTGKASVADCPAFRISFVLREFPNKPSCEIFFKYPIHVVDETGVLHELGLEGQKMSNEEMTRRNSSKAGDRKEEYKEWTMEKLDAGETVTVAMVMAEFGIKSRNTVKAWIDTDPDLERDQKGTITLKK